MYIKKLLKNLIPPILHPSTIKNYYTNLIKDKDRFEYEKNFYTRHSFILRAIFNKSKNCNYLEIGVSDGDVFNTIPLKLKNKYGVDPLKGGTDRKTSDIFFKENKVIFDVIFIDGLHTYEQCKKDFLNSIKFLKEDGIIIFHDLLPRNSMEQQVPRKSYLWNGDVWKLGVEISKSENSNFKIVNIDTGVGIFKNNSRFKYKNIVNIEEQDFNIFYHKYYKNLPIINSEEALIFIDD